MKTGISRNRVFVRSFVGGLAAVMATMLLISGVTMTTANAAVEPRPNPDLHGSCGQNVAIVADLSWSMEPLINGYPDPDASLPKLKKALGTYLDGLQGSNTNVALYTFGSYSPDIDPLDTQTTGGNVNYKLTSVQEKAGVEELKKAISKWRGFGWTRWDLGLQKVADSTDIYDYVLFITDGYPTTASGGDIPNQDGIITAANNVKAKDTKIIVIFAPSGGLSMTSTQEKNIQAISGKTTNKTGTEILQNDYYSSNWTIIGEQLAAMANKCAPTVNEEQMEATRTIHYLDANDQTMAPDVVQKVSYTKKTDLSSNEVTYEPENLSFGAVDTPLKLGFSPDKLSVGSTTVSAGPDPIALVETVRYKPVFSNPDSSWTVVPTTSVAGETIPYANGNSTERDYWTATLTAKNQTGAAVTDLDVSAISFTVNPTKGVTISSPVKNNKDGTYSVMIASTVAASPEVTVTYKGQQVGEKKTISFQPGAFSYDKSTFDVSPPATSDKSTWVTVSEGDKYYTGILTATDEYENPLTDLTADDIEFSAFPSAKVAITDVVNHQDGTYTVHYSSTLADATSPTKLAQVTYKDRVVGTPKPIPFKAGVESVKPKCDTGIDGTNLSVDKNSLSVGETSYAVALVTDEFCNVKEGVTVTFSLDPAKSGSLSTTTATTDQYGKAYATVTDNVAETVTLHATITADEIDSAQDITFVEGELSADNSTFSVYPTDLDALVVVADGVQSWTGKLVARDGKNNLLSKLETSNMVFTVVPDGVTVSSVSNDGGGAYTVTYTSTTAGSYTAALTYNGTKVGEYRPISFVADVVDGAHSSVSVDPTSQVAGSSVTVTVTARDENNNPVLGLTADEVVVVGTAAMLPDLTISDFTRLPNGVYTYQATSRLVGKFEVTARVASTTLTDKPHVTFYAGVVCAGNPTPEDPNNITKFVMGDNDAVADGIDENSATAYAFDCFGNAVEGAAVTVNDMTTNGLTGYLTPAKHEVTTGSDGTVTVRWTSKKAGTFQAEGTIGGSYREGSFMEIRFSNGQGNAKKSSLVVAPDTTIVVEDSFTAKVTVRDATGNMVAGENVSFWLDPASPARLSADYCTTRENGTCEVTVTSDLVTKVIIHAAIRKDELGGNGVEVEKSPQAREFVAGGVCVTDCTPVDPTHVTRVVVTADGAVANGEATDVAKAFAYDKKGNAVVGVVVTSSTSDTALGIGSIAKTDANGITEIFYTSTVAGAHTAFVRIDSKDPTQAVSFDNTITTITTDGRITLNFGSDAASAKDSSLTIDPTTSQQVNSTFTVTAHVVDGKNNPVNNAVVNFPAVDNLTFNKTSCTSGKDGTCQVTVTSRLMGTYTVSAKLGNDDLNTVDAVFTPGPVCVPAVDECDPENGHYTHVEVTTDGATADGDDRDVATVKAYDRYGNPVEGVLVQSAAHAGETSLTVQPNVIPTDASGMTMIWYTSTVRGGHQADVTIGGKNPETSPITVNFGSGDGDANHSSWVVAPKNSLSAPLTVGQGDDNTYTATATVKDAQNNPVQDAVVTFSIDPSGSPVFTPENKNTCQTDEQGKCSVSVYSTRSGTYSMQAKITGGWIKNSDTHEVSAPVGWKADSVCSKDADCDPVNPELAKELRTRVEIVDNNKAADGIEQDTVIVWAFDKWGNAVEGAPVQSTTDDSTLSIRSRIPSINKSGSSLIWYTSTVAGDHTAFILVDGVTPVNAPVTLTFVSGDLSTDTSTFEVYRTDPDASVVVADGKQSWTGSLVARDKNYNLLSGLDIKDMVFTVASDDVTVSDVNEKGNGVYLVTYTSTKSGSYAAALTYKDKKVGADEPISFVADVMDDKHSTVTVSPPRQVAGSSVTVTVTARDVNDNPVLGLNAADILVVGTADDLPDLAISDFTRLPNGVYTYQATSKLIGEFEVRATVTDKLLDGAPHVVFYSGGVCVNGATPVVPENITRFDPVVSVAVANGIDQDSARAYAYDCLGNPVEGASVVVDDKTTGDLAGYLHPEQQSVTTDSDGTAMIYWTSKKAGIFTAEGTINNLRPATGVMNWIRFNSGLGDPSKSELVVTPQSPIQVENFYTATVTVRDMMGNFVPNENVFFSLDPTSPATLSAKSCSTDAEGTCSVKVSSDLVTTVAIHAILPKVRIAQDLGGNGDLAKASPQTVEFTAGPVCVSNCKPVDPTHVTRVEVIADGAVANGKATDVAKAYAYDNKGNAVEGIVVTSSTSDSALGIGSIAKTDADGITEIHYTSTVAGTHAAFVMIDSKVPTQAVSFDQTTAADGQIKLNFGSGAASAKGSSLTIDPTTSQPVNSTFTVTAHVVDGKNNPVSNAVVSFPAVDNLTFNKTSCVSGSDGTCQVTVTSRLMGAYSVSAKLGDDDLNNSVDAVFTPGPVCVAPAEVCNPVNPDNYSRVEVTLNGQRADGQAHDIATVWAYDYDGNPVTDVVVQSAPAASETSLTVQPNVDLTGQDGTTTIWYASTVTGGHKADVTIGGKIAKNSPITVSFGSGDGDANHSSWVVAPKNSIPAPLTVGEGADNMYIATATVADAQNNPVKDAVVTFSINPSGNPQFTPENTCQTDDQGKCSVSVYSTRSGTYSMQAKITDGWIKNAVTHDVSASLAWKADSVCSKDADCDPVNPELAQELRTRVEIVDNGKAADGVARDTVTVWAFDKWGNAVEGALVQSVSQDAAMTVQTGIDSINKDGTSTIWYTSTVAGDHTASVLVDGVTPVNAPVTLTFISGDLSPDTSTFQVFRTDPDASVVVADGVQSWTGKLVARDGKNNVLPKLDTSNMVFTVVPGGVTVSKVSNDGGGAYTVTYTSTKSGSYTAALTYKGTKVGADEPISFVADVADDKYSTVTVSPDRQVAGSSVTVRVTVRDVNDNPVLGLNAADIVVVGTADDLPDLAISNFSTIADGVYTYQATSKLIGDFEVRATVTDKLLDEAPHVVFYSGGVCVNGATPVVPGNVTRFEAVVPAALANGVDQVSAMAYAYDCLGNPVEGASVVVEDKSTGDIAGYLRPEQQSVTTDSEGTALVYWTSTKAGLFTAEGTINNLRPATGVMNWIRFNSGLGDPSKSELVVTPESPIQVGNSYTAKVTVRDATGNLAPGETVSFSVDPSTPATLSENFCTTGLDGTCSVRVSSDLVTTVAIHATLPKDGRDVDLGGNGDTAKASPQTVAFTAGPVCVVDCHPVDPTHVTRVEVVTDGAMANGKAIDVAKVWAYDNTGNPTPGKVVTSSTYDPDLGIKVVARTDEDGTAEINYTSTTAGPHMAFVFVDSRIPAKAQSSDGIRDDGRITVNFGSGAASAKNSDLTIDPAGSQQVNSTFTVTAHVRDANLNNVSGSVVTFPPVENLTFDKTSCVSGADGTCQVTVSSRLAGTYEVRGLLNQQDVSNTVNAVFTAGQACVPTVDVCDPVNPDNVSRVKVTLDGQTADGLSHDIATVWVYDYDGNPVKDALVQSAPAAGETKLMVQPNVTPTNADGVTTIWYASTVKGGHKADVTIAGKTPEASPIQVTFGAGGGDTVQSSWTVTPNGPLTVGQDANSTYIATATVKDKANNPVQDATVVFSIDPSLAPVFTPQNTCQTNEQGVCSVSVYSTKSGTYSMTASITAGPIKNSDTREASAPVAWKADAVCSKAEGCDPVNPELAKELRTRVEIVDNNKVADGVERDTVIVWAFDQWGNPAEGALVQSTSGNTDLNIQTGISPINKDGFATIWYTSMVAGTYPTPIFVDAQKATDPPVEVTFVAGPVCVVEAGCEPVGPGTNPKRQTHVTVDPNDQAVNGSDIVAVHAFDKTGNAVSGVEFQIGTNDLTLSFAGSRTRIPVVVASGENNTVAGTSAISGSHTASARVNGVELTGHGSPMDLRFLGAPVITSPTDGGLDNGKPLVITGTGQTPGDRIVVTEGTDQVCEAVVRDNLTWSCEASLTDGSHTLTAVETNKNGVDSPDSTPVTVVIDTTPPAPPTVEESKGSQITGTTEPGTTVTVTDKDGKPVEGCVDVVPDEQGNFSCRPTTPIPPETTVTVTAVDPAGNVSGPTPLDIVALGIDVVHETRDPGQDQVVSGHKFNPGEQVCLFLGETEMSCGTADEKGTVTFTFTVPSTAQAGPQFVTLKGAESGNVSGTFEVGVIQVQTGATAHHSGEPWVLAVGCLLAAAGVLGATRWTAAAKK